jgi:outer membrane protein assembly factor BamB
MRTDEELTGLQAVGAGDGPLGDEGLPLPAGYAALARVRRSASAVEYVGRDTDGTTVLLTVPRPGSRADVLADSLAALRLRFRAEGELGLRAGGPWVAPVRRVLDDCVVSTYRPALSLDTAVTRYGPLRAHELRILGAALAEALARLHTLVPVHRGLAPHTVRLASDGPLLAGFGPLAAATEVRVDGHELHLVLDYLTPEQVTRHAPGPPSDVFVLGLLLCYAATGASPFRPATREAVASDAADLDGVPEELRPLLARCLAKDPAARPTPAEIAAGLAPDGVPALLAAGWLSGPLMSALSRQATSVLALDAPVAAAAPGEGPAATLVAPTSPATSPVPSPVPGPTPGPRLPSRRTLLTAGAALAVGAVGGWAVTRATENPEQRTRPAAAARRRVPGTAPTALWHHKIAETIADPVVWQDKVLVVPMVGPTAGLDLRTGRTLWSKRLTGYGPVPLHDDLMLGIGGGGFVTFSPMTGTVHRTVRHPEYYTEEFLGVSGTRVWFASTATDFGTGDSTVHLVCYDAVDNDEVWRTRLPSWCRGVSDLTLTDSSVHVRLARTDTGKKKHKAVFATLDRETGKIRRQQSYGKVLTTDLALIHPTGTLFVEEGEVLRAYDLESGDALWGHPYSATAEPGSQILTPRAMTWVDGSLYVVDGIRMLYEINPRDGKPRWTSKSDGYTLDPPPLELADLFGVTTGRPPVTGPVRTPLYRLDDRTVTACSFEDGSPLWVFDGTDEPASVPSRTAWQVFSGSRTAVFSRSRSQHLYALPIG